MATSATVDPVEELVQRLRDGDASAFRDLVDAWSPAMLRMAQGYVANRQLASIGAPSAWNEPETRSLDDESQGLVEVAVGALPARQRDVLTLRDVHGFTAAEACTALGLSAQNQRVLLHRACAACARVSRIITVGDLNVATTGAGPAHRPERGGSS